MEKKSHHFLDEDGLNSRQRKEEGWGRHRGARQGPELTLEKPSRTLTETPGGREERGQTLQPVCTGSSWYGNRIPDEEDLIGVCVVTALEVGCVENFYSVTCVFSCA